MCSPCFLRSVTSLKLMPERLQREFWYGSVQIRGVNSDDCGQDMPLHAALRAGASARVLLALIAAYPAAAGSRAQPVRECSLGPKVALGPRVGAGALPLLLALRAGADVEVTRAPTLIRNGRVCFPGFCARPHVSIQSTPLPHPLSPRSMILSK